MSDSVGDTLERLLKARGITMKAASLKLGKTHSYIQQFITRGKPKKLPEDVRHGLARLLDIDERELRHPSQKNLPTTSLSPNSATDTLLAVESSVLPVIGKVQAGVWEVVDLVDQSEYADETVVVPIDPRFPFKDQWAMQIVGDSVNEFAPSGSYAVCVDISAGLDVRHGQMVVVERLRAQGAEIERTIKQFRIEGGRRELWPRSTNPKHNGPIRLDPENGEECEIRVKGIVLSFVIVAPGID
ncbi:MAG: S24 family peptidase [Parvibaculaceae bacterium]|nr:S24 family peptidase [Parvibaculaceae bacterium]